MIKLLEKYGKSLSNSQLGLLMKMTVYEGEYETDDEVVNYLYKNEFKPTKEHYEEVSEKRRKARLGKTKKKTAETSTNEDAEMFQLPLPL